MEFVNIEVSHMQHALRGMRNAMSGWDKSDTIIVTDEHLRTIDTMVGTSDRDLARRLIKAGAPHRKFMRQISVIVDIIAPAYFWAELDTYKVGTVRDSSSFMHTGMARPFTIDDFEVDDGIRTVLTPYTPADKDYSLVYPGNDEDYKVFTAEDGREYKVFKCGRVHRCAFTQTRHMKDGSIRKVDMPEKEFKPAQANTGYYHLYIGGKMVYLHRLVASVWCPRGVDCDVVDHIDGNKGNNSADNLEWVTKSENDKRKIRSGLAPFWGSIRHRYLQYKANCHPESVRRDIRFAYENETGVTFKELSERFGVCETRVADIVRGTDVTDPLKNQMFEQARFWERTIDSLNELRSLYLSTGDDRYFLGIRRLLPMSYLYRSTWTCSYENLIEIWRWRRNHRLPAWHEFCEKFIAKLPYSEFITEYPYEEEDK